MLGAVEGELLLVGGAQVGQLAAALREELVAFRFEAQDGFLVGRFDVVDLFVLGLAQSGKGFFVGEAQGVVDLLVLDFGELQSGRLRGLQSVDGPVVFGDPGVQLRLKGFDGLLLVGLGGLQSALEAGDFGAVFTGSRIEGVLRGFLGGGQRLGVHLFRLFQPLLQQGGCATHRQFVLLTQRGNGVVFPLQGIRQAQI